MEKQDRNQSPTHKNRRHQSHDVLKEVNEFINKERQNLEKSFLFQRYETEVWKDRYDDLISKVSQSVNVTGDYRPLEVLADREERNSRNQTMSSDIDPYSTKAFVQTETDWILDLSNNAMTLESLKTIAKDSRRLESYMQIKAILLSRCELVDAHSTVLSTFLRNPSFSGFDFSFNVLGAEFFSQFVEAMQVRGMH